MSLCLECRQPLTKPHKSHCSKLVSGEHPLVVQVDCSDPTYVELARKQHHVGGECEIDNNATVSYSQDSDAPGGIRGAYVQAWIFVENPSVHVKECDDEDPGRSHDAEWPHNRW